MCALAWARGVYPGWCVSFGLPRLLLFVFPLFFLFAAFLLSHEICPRREGFSDRTVIYIHIHPNNNNNKKELVKDSKAERVFARAHTHTHTLTCVKSFGMLPPCFHQPNSGFPTEACRKGRSVVCVTLTFLI